MARLVDARIDQASFGAELRWTGEFQHELTSYWGSGCRDLLTASLRNVAGLGLVSSRQDNCSVLVGLARLPRFWDFDLDSSRL